MTNLKAVLSKLAEGSVVIESISKQELIIDTQIGNLRVSYIIKSSSFAHLPFQAILTIDKQKTVLYTWGCTSNEDNKELVGWFDLRYNELEEKRRKQRISLEKSFKQWLQEGYKA